VSPSSSFEAKRDSSKSEIIFKTFLRRKKSVSARQNLKSFFEIRLKRSEKKWVVYLGSAQNHFFKSD
jgi:hypothetical protein